MEFPLDAFPEFAFTAIRRAKNCASWRSAAASLSVESVSAKSLADTVPRLVRRLSRPALLTGLMTRTRTAPHQLRVRAAKRLIEGFRALGYGRLKRVKVREEFECHCRYVPPRLLWRLLRRLFSRA